MVEFPYTCCVLTASVSDPRDIQADGVRNVENCYNHDNTQDVYFWEQVKLLCVSCCLQSIK